MFVWVHKENERKEYNGKESKMFVWVIKNNTILEPKKK
jgi:hypothetical protein